MSGLISRRSFLAASAALPLVAYAPHARAEHNHEPDNGYYFEQESFGCGNFAPVDPVFITWSRGNRDFLRFEMTITEEQIANWNCSGSHFDVRISLAGFYPTVDWSDCTVHYEHEFTFGWEVIDTGGGSATAVVSGAKLTQDRMYPGYVYGIELDCPELRYDRHSEPTVSVQYLGAWYSIDPAAGEVTRFVTDETVNNAGGLPVYVEYTGQNAWVVNADGDREFPLYR